MGPRWRELFGRCWQHGLSQRQVQNMRALCIILPNMYCSTKARAGASHKLLLAHSHILALQVKRAILWTARDAEVRCGRPGWVCDCVLHIGDAVQACVSFGVVAFPVFVQRRMYQARRPSDAARCWHCHEGVEKGTPRGQGWAHGHSARSENVRSAMWPCIWSRSGQIRSQLFRKRRELFAPGVLEGRRARALG